MIYNYENDLDIHSFVSKFEHYNGLQQIYVILNFVSTCNDKEAAVEWLPLVKQ